MSLHRRCLLASVATLLAFVPAGLGPAAAEPTPQPHYHDYWGDRDHVDVFDGTVVTTVDGLRDGCARPSHRVFDLEDDGNEANPNDPPVNTQVTPERADAVFPGTSRLDVRLLAVDPLPTAVFLRYKPTHVGAYSPADCGIPLEPGHVVSIPVEAWQTDPPHEWSVSGWRFDVTTTAVGASVTLEITAIRGRALTLDPGHPDLYGSAASYDLGCIEGTVVHAVAVHGRPVSRQPDQMTDLSWAYGCLVPLLTASVDLRLHYHSTGVVPVGLRLDYHAADSDQYRPAPHTDGPLYTIPDPQGILADPPYEDQTWWGLRLVPVSATEPDAGTVGEFEGSYEVCATAFRDPNAVLA